MPRSSTQYAAHKVWDPRLHPYEEDALVFRDKDFDAVFSKRTQTIATRHTTLDLWEVLSPVLSMPRWVRCLFCRMVVS
jgi:hypothetical protein